MVELQMTAGSSSTSRPLSKKPSARNLNIVSPTGARPKLSRSATLANHHAHHHHHHTLSLDDAPPLPRYTPKPPKSTPANRGLTLRIDSGSNTNIQSLRSAPARSVRRLPAVPDSSGGARGSPMEEGALFESMPQTPFTAPAGQFGERSRARRCVRPLPRLPTQGGSASSGSRSASVTPTTVTTTTMKLTPTARSRSVKPLPVPVIKEPFVLSRVAPGKEADGVLPAVSTPVRVPGTCPYAEQQSTGSDVQDQVVGNADGEAGDAGWDGDWDEEDMDDLEEGVIQLGNRIVLRKISNVSLDSDSTSEEEEEPPSKLKKKESLDGEEYIDYSWVLSNRMLYRQGDTQVVSKWMLERKGKRYTEQDYENIIQALRIL